MSPETDTSALQNLERKLNTLTLRLADLERRLARVERQVFPRETPPVKPLPREEGVRHTYLKRAIIAAKREYEEKHG